MAPLIIDKPVRQLSLSQRPPNASPWYRASCAKYLPRYLAARFPLLFRPTTSRCCRPLASSFFFLFALHIQMHPRQPHSKQLKTPSCAHPASRKTLPRLARRASRPDAVDRPGTLRYCVTSPRHRSQSVAVCRREDLVCPTRTPPVAELRHCRGVCRPGRSP